MALDKDNILSYGRIDTEDLDAEELIAAAEMYIINAIEVKDSVILEGNPIYRLCVKMLVSHWYDNRGVAADKLLRDIPMGVQSLITQLSNCYVPESTVVV